jgi:hypothetical protein
VSNPAEFSQEEMRCRTSLEAVHRAWVMFLEYRQAGGIATLERCLESLGKIGDEQIAGELREAIGRVGYMISSPLKEKELTRISQMFSTLMGVIWQRCDRYPDSRDEIVMQFDRWPPHQRVRK